MRVACACRDDGIVPRRRSVERIHKHRRGYDQHRQHRHRPQERRHLLQPAWPASEEPDHGYIYLQWQESIQEVTASLDFSKTSHITIKPLDIFQRFL